MLLPIEVSLHCQMCDLSSKFEEDPTKTAVAIVEGRLVDRHTHTHRTVIHSSDFISVQCHALHWTDIYERLH